MTYPLDLGCTAAQHKRIGIHAVINARAGRQDLNQSPLDTPHEMEMLRDSWKAKDHQEKRIAIHQFNSRWFRKRMSHLVTPYSDY